MVIIPTKEMNMAFVGIITSPQKESVTEKQLQALWRELGIEKNQVLLIHKHNISSMQHIHFQIVMIQQDNPVLHESMDALKVLLEHCEYVILNTDIAMQLEKLGHLKLQIITYGFHLKSTITASSLEQDQVQLCLQRSIQNFHHQLIEPGEVSVSLQKKDVYQVMEKFILRILYQKNNE